MGIISYAPGNFSTATRDHIHILTRQPLPLLHASKDNHPNVTQSTCRRTEQHWYEAHGIGPRKLKVKRILEEQ